MGYIFSKSGEEFGKRVFAEVRGKLLPISIVDIPFLPNNFIAEKFKEIQII